MCGTMPHSMAGSEGPDMGVVVNTGGGGDVLRKKDMEVLLLSVYPLGEG